MEIDDIGGVADETDGGLGTADAEGDETRNTARAVSGGGEREALDRLRQVLIDSDPLVAPSLVHGDTVAELEASFAAAKAAAQHARDLTLAAAAPRVSSGAPGRANASPATAFEKIRAGLLGRS